MDKFYEVILGLCNAAIHNSEFNVDVVLEWNLVKDVLTFGKMKGITVKQIGIHKQNFGLTDSDFETLRQQMFARGVQQMMHLRHLDKVLRLAEEHHLHPVIFKGAVLAELYPEPFMRYSSDVDIYIDESESELMGDVLLNMGFVEVLSQSKKHVSVFVDSLDGMKIELHNCLWEDYEGKQVQLLEQIGFTLPEHLVQQRVMGIDMVTIRPEEHLVYQIFHMAKHLAFEGLPLRYLADLTLFIERYSAEIDWEHFWKSIYVLKYETFTATLFSICKNYLELNKEIHIPRDINVHSEIKLIEDIMSYGIKREDVNEAYATTGFVEQYFMRDHVQSQKRITKVRMLFFPTSGELKTKFGYAKRNPFLLPIAWIHRFCSAIHYTIMCKRKGLSSFKVVEKAEHRIDLIAELNIIDVE